MKPPKCKYEDKPYWDDSHIQHTFSCNEFPLSSGLCIFHDRNFLNKTNKSYESNANEIRIKFKVKLEKCIESNSEGLFIGYILPNLEMENKTITNNMYFMYSEFVGSIKITNVHFNKKLTFTSGRFNGTVDFRNCIFNKIDFNGNTIFYKNLHFYKNEFKDVADFSSAEFCQDVHISSNTFREDAGFGYTKYHEEAHFQQQRFEKNVSFHFSEFKKEGDFDGTYFSNLFFNATESNRLVFSNTTFVKLEFRMSLVETCLFWQSEFLGEVELSQNMFKLVDFRRCKFQEVIDFSKTCFDEVDFTYALFANAAYFIETKFPGKAFFNYVRFEKPTEVIIQRTNLSNVSFGNTDLTRINFGDGIVFGDNFILFDERRLINKEFEEENERSKINLGTVLATYRNLRENYEFRLKYDEAGKFFIREMELKRKYKEVDKNDYKKALDI